MDKEEAARRIKTIFHGADTAWIREGNKLARDSWANLKYYTWVEQQGKGVDELRAQRNPEYWLKEQLKIPDIDKAILEQRTC
jgi:hypothetical protein